jgi:two-component sensor histidine kinase
MAEDKADSRVATLEKELHDLWALVADLRRQLQQQGVDAADAALASARSDYTHARDMASERDKTAAVQRQADSETVRADAAELHFADVTALHDALLKNSTFNRMVLETTTDCIKVLDLDGRLEFMNAGGQRVMEVDDFAKLALCPWVEFWQGEEHAKASAAVEAAKAGKTSRFEGMADTAKGNQRWWEVIVSPILGPDGEPQKILSLSRDVTIRHEADLQRRLLFNEMHHRIKNTLAIVQAITQQSFRHSTDPKEAADSIAHRLAAMGKAHDLLILNEWISAEINDVVKDAVDAYVGDEARMAVTGESLLLSSRAALTMAMLLNELCTNAVKYGAWSDDSGFVEISWAVTGSTFSFRWVETDGPAVEPPSRRGFGSRLIEGVLPSSLGGQATASYNPDGFVFQLDAPLSALTAIEPPVTPSPT